MRSHCRYRSRRHVFSLLFSLSPFISAFLSFPCLAFPYQHTLTDTLTDMHRKREREREKEKEKEKEKGRERENAN